MPAPPARTPDPAALAEVIAEQVRDHPSVADLHGGPFGTVASYLPGRRVVGVRVDEANGSVQLSVVLRLGHPLPKVIADLRQRVAAVAGPVPVDVTVADLHTADEDEPGAAANAG